MQINHMATTLEQWCGAVASWLSTTAKMNIINGKKNTPENKMSVSGVIDGNSVQKVSR